MAIQQALYTRVVDGVTWYAVEDTRPACGDGDGANCRFLGITHRGGMAQRECVGCCYTESTAPNVDRCEFRRFPHMDRDRCRRLTDRRCVTCFGAVCADHLGHAGECASCIVDHLPERI